MQLRVLSLSLGAGLLAATVSAQTPAATQTPAAPQPSAEAPAAPASQIPWQGVFTIGGVGTDTSGNPLRVNEFVVARDAVPSLTLDFWGERGDWRYDVAAWNGGDSRAQRYEANLAFRRLLKASVSYQRFTHRLDHDPIDYVDAASNINGTFVARHTNHDPGAEYGLGRGELHSRVELTLPTKTSIRFFLGHRQQMTSGSHQAMTTNHCATCHLESFTRGVDEMTRDLNAGARVAFDKVVLEYHFQNRLFRDDAPTLLNQYDDAKHPATLADVFLNRVQYDDAAGLLPFATVAGLSKNAHTFRARVDLPREADLTGTFTMSRSRNDDTRLETTYQGGGARLVVPLHQKLTLRADFRRYDIESDDVFVDVVELVSPAGPTAGLTYVQAYPAIGSVDYVRESSLSRTPTTVATELIYRPFKRTWVRGGYEWEEIRRDAFEVHKTTTNAIFLSGRSQLHKQLNYRMRFRYEDINDPFVYEAAAIPQVLQPFMSPGNVPFTGLQYFEMYDSRQGDLTSFPTQTLRLDQSISWSPRPNVTVAAHYNFRDSQNDDLNYSTWGRTAHSPGVDVWIAPGDRWSISAGYGYQRERLETLFSTLAFVG